MLVSSLAFGVALVAAAPVLRAHVIDSFESPLGTMQPTVIPGDHLLVDMRRWQPRRGDIVVFRYPPPPAPDFSLRLKRVVAIAGDTVEIRDGHLVVNGTPVPTRRIATAVPAAGVHKPAPAGGYDQWEEVLDGHRYRVLVLPSAAGSSAPVFVPPDHVFVVGDHRDDNNDSRRYGPMQVPAVLGRATRIWWSRAPTTGVRWDRLGQRL